MPQPISESTFFENKEPPKQLTLEFDAGDDVLELIQQQCKENGAKEYKVLEAAGRVKWVKLNFFNGPQFMSKGFENVKVDRGSGNFKQNGSEYWGELKVVFPKGNRLQNGSAIELIAEAGFTLKLQFVRV